MCSFRVFHQQASSFDAGFLGMELVLYGLVLFYVVAEVHAFQRVRVHLHIFVLVSRAIAAPFEIARMVMAICCH